MENCRPVSRVNRFRFIKGRSRAMIFELSSNIPCMARNHGRRGVCHYAVCNRFRVATKFIEEFLCGASLSLSLRDAVDVKIELDSGSPVFLFPRVSIYSRMIEKMRDKVRLLSSGSIVLQLSSLRLFSHVCNVSSTFTNHYCSVTPSARYSNWRASKLVTPRYSPRGSSNFRNSSLTNRAYIQSLSTIRECSYSKYNTRL